MTTKKQVTFYEFDPVLYPMRLWIVVTNNIDLVNEKFESYPEGEDLILGRGSDGGVRTVMHKKKKYIGVIMMFTSKRIMTVECIAHESAHTATEVWHHLHEYNIANEANAYLTGWVAECCWKVKIGKL